MNEAEIATARLPMIYVQKVIKIWDDVFYCPFLSLGAGLKIQSLKNTWKNGTRTLQDILKIVASAKSSPAEPLKLNIYSRTFRLLR